MSDQKKEIKQEDEKLSESDFHALEVANMRKLLAESHLEVAKSKYDNIVLQVSVKYGLTDKDSINEQGKIVRGEK